MKKLQPSPPPPANVTYVGHATVLIEMDGVTILTDPVMRKRLWHLKRQKHISPCDFDFSQVDAVLLSHMHFDHMDYPSLRMLPNWVPVITPEGGARYLNKKVPHDVVEMKEGDTVTIGSVKIEGAPSRHESGFCWPFWFSSNVLSYLVHGSRTMYFVGDTALFRRLKEVGESCDIDLALLPVWGYGPYIRGDHMSPADAASAVSLLSPKIAVPIHWGTLSPIGPFWRRMSFMSDPPYAFAWEASRQAPSTDIRVLNPGESTMVG